MILCSCNKNTRAYLKVLSQPIKNDLHYLHSVFRIPRGRSQYALAYTSRTFLVDQDIDRFRVKRLHRLKPQLILDRHRDLFLL
jgi:hypothetical protein